MTVTYRSATNPSGASWSAGSHLIATPSGVAEHDLLFMVMQTTSDANFVIVPPFDWTALGGSGGGINGVDNLVVFYKEAGSSEPSSYDVLTVGSGIYGVGIFALYSSTGARLKIADFESQYNASSGNRVYPSVDFPSAGLLVCIGGGDSTAASTPPGTMTERWDITISSSKLYLMTGAVASAGASGTRTATGTAQISRCISIAIVEETPEPSNAVQFRWGNSAISGNASGGGNVTFSAPSHLGENDLLLLTLMMEDTRSVTFPAGFELVTADEINAGDEKFWVYQKTATISDIGATFDVAISGSGTVGYRGIAFAFYCIDGTPLEITSFSVKLEDGVEGGTSESLGATKDNSLYVVLVGRGSPTSVSYQLTDLTNTWKQIDSGGSGASRIALFASRLLETGASGTRTFEPSSSGLTEDHAIISLMIERLEVPAVITHDIYPSEGYYAVVYDGIDVTAYVQTGSLTAAVEQLAVLTLSMAEPQSEPGSTSWDIQLEGLLEKEIDDLLGMEALAPPDGPLKNLSIRYGAMDNGTLYSWEGDHGVGAFVGNYRIGPNTEFESIPFRASLRTSGQPTREVLT